MKKKELKNEAEKNEAINVNFRNERKIWEFLKKEEEKMSKKLFEKWNKNVNQCTNEPMNKWLNKSMNKWINE